MNLIDLQCMLFNIAHVHFANDNDKIQIIGFTILKKVLRARSSDPPTGIPAMLSSLVGAVATQAHNDDGRESKMQSKAI